MKTRDQQTQVFFVYTIPCASVTNMANTPWLIVASVAPQRTATADDEAALIQQVLEQKRDLGRLPKDAIIVTVADPLQQVGSGGAALHGLLAAAEHLSARAGLSLVDPKVLRSASVILLQFGPCRSAWPYPTGLLALPTKSTHETYDIVDGIFETLSRITPKETGGIWLCSTEAVWLSHLSSTRADLPLTSDAIIWTRLAGPREATEHGVVHTDGQTIVNAFQYQPEVNLLKDSNALVTGLVFLNGLLAQRLVELTLTSPLDACTYLGIDAGAKPLKVSLYFDILLSMLPNSPPRGPSRSEVAFQALQQGLRGFHLTASPLPHGVYHSFVPSALADCTRLFRSITTWQEANNPKQLPIQSWVPNNQETGLIHTSVLPNEIEMDDTNWIIGVNASALKTSIRLKPGIALQQRRLQSNKACFILFNVDGSTSLLQHLAGFLKTLWQKAELFRVFDADDAIAASQALQMTLALQTITAEQFETWHNHHDGMERISIETALQRSSLVAELIWRDQCGINERILSAVQSNDLNAQFLDDILRTCALPCRFGFDQHQSMLALLDRIAAEGPHHTSARALAAIADLLGMLAGVDGGLRSGPSANPKFSKSFELLADDATIKNGIALLAEERSSWLSTPRDLLRAARHYEGANQILTRKAVITAKVFTDMTVGDPLPLDFVAEATAPVRLDLAGGWSDTPPITYEHGGVVTNVSITVDGQRPIGARVRRITTAELVFVLGSSDDANVVRCSELDDLRDYNQPLAPGALLKAAIIAADVVDLNSPKPLKDQLMDLYGGGFELQTWSNLPQGSGLGTSSILAGALLAALGRATGRQFKNTDALIHAVLYLEQLLTTGGGWQDQTGGLFGGFKIGRSACGLPLRVNTDVLNVPQQFINDFQSHLLLIYTGKTRLARDLLQSVLRRWFSRQTQIVSTVNALVANAEECARAIVAGDIQAVGLAVGTYWQQKKIMAGDCEPAVVTKIISIVEPHSWGVTMTGAGGGGFMFCVLKRANIQQELQQLITTELQGYQDALSTLSFHSAEIDTKGLHVDVYKHSDSGGQPSQKRQKTTDQ